MTWLLWPCILDFQQSSDLNNIKGDEKMQNQITKYNSVLYLLRTDLQIRINSVPEHMSLLLVYIDSTHSCFRLCWVYSAMAGCLVRPCWATASWAYISNSTHHTTLQAAVSKDWGAPGYSGSESRHENIAKFQKTRFSCLFLDLKGKLTHFRISANCWILPSTTEKQWQH